MVTAVAAEMTLLAAIGSHVIHTIAAAVVWVIAIKATAHIIPAITIIMTLYAAAAFGMRYAIINITAMPRFSAKVIIMIATIAHIVIFKTASADAVVFPIEAAMPILAAINAVIMTAGVTHKMPLDATHGFYMRTPVIAAVTFYAAFYRLIMIPVA